MQEFLEDGGNGGGVGVMLDKMVEEEISGIGGVAIADQEL